MADDFRILVPSGFRCANFPVARGAIGPKLDTSWLGPGRDEVLVEGFSGKTIPKFARDLEFYIQNQKDGRISDIYAYTQFWLVSDRQKLALEKSASDDFEFCVAKTFLHDGSRTADRFWLAKVLTTLDCVDEDASMFTLFQKEDKPLRDAAYEIELAPDLVEHFGNYDTSTYRSYPSHRYIKNIVFQPEKIHDDCQIFVPKYWPGYVVIRSRFAEALHFGHGYSLWSLRTEDVAQNFRDDLIALR